MEKEVLGQVADVVTNEPITLSVDILPKNRAHAYLQRRGWLPTKKVFTLKGATLGTMVKISKLLLDVDISHFKTELLLDSNYRSISTDGPKMALAIAHCIHNRPGQPAKSLVDFILYNFTAQELYRTLTLVLKQMDVSSFMTSIIYIKGVNILDKQIASVKSAE